MLILAFYIIFRHITIYRAKSRGYKFEGINYSLILYICLAEINMFFGSMIKALFSFFSLENSSYIHF